MAIPGCRRVCSLLKKDKYTYTRDATVAWTKCSNSSAKGGRNSTESKFSQQLRQTLIRKEIHPYHNSHYFRSRTNETQKVSEAASALMYSRSIMHRFEDKVMIMIRDDQRRHCHGRGCSDCRGIYVDSWIRE